MYHLRYVYLMVARVSSQYARDFAGGWEKKTRKLTLLYKACAAS